MSDFFSPDFLFRNAILGGLGVALLCSVLGIYLVLRRLVLIGVALPQAGAAGIAAVFWLTGHGHAGAASTHLLALSGSLVATFGALALLVAGQRRSRSPAEWGVGALFALSSAATILFVALNPKGDVEMAGLLRGELLAITEADLRMLGGVLLAVGSLFFLFRRDLLLSSFDPEFARTIGRDPFRYDLLLYFLIGGGIALGVMTAGPLLVFGFLVLPALAALRVAPGLGSAFAISAVVAVLSFLGGFGLSYRADLPAGPVCVAVAGACWALASLTMRLRASRRAAALLVLAAALATSAGCASRFAAAGERGSAPLPRGTLPESVAGRPIAVLPFANATGQTLRMPQSFLKDVGRAMGDPFAESSPTVPDLLQQRAALELERRGFEVVPVEEVRAALAHAPDEPLAAVRTAARAGLEGPMLAGTLRRFTITQTGLLLVRLDLVLIDPRDEHVLWSGAARRPVPIQAALTWQEILLDAGPPIFAEAFGGP
ncbi:MAG TPA: metal ABC transporter permease [Myxococcota bacterium]|nr:metal ABC transporter permease [Myxococcota bacterium]